VEEEVERRLSSSGWGDRAVAIAIDPELEIWVWSDSPQVDDVLGWRQREPQLRDWLRNEGFLTGDNVKPSAPKRAVDEALRIAGKGRSSSIFGQLAQRVSVARCEDPAFLKFKATLQKWFGLPA
jgi:hypothetical protein